MTLPLQYRLVSSGDLTGLLSVVPCDRSFDCELGSSDGCSVGSSAFPLLVVCVLFSSRVFSRIAVGFTLSRIQDRSCHPMYGLTFVGW